MISDIENIPNDLEFEEQQYLNREKNFDVSAKDRFFEYREGRNYIRFYCNPVTKELVVLREWYESDGEDDVIAEFEVEGIYPPIVCLEAKKAKYMKNGKQFLLDLINKYK